MQSAHPVWGNLPIKKIIYSIVQIGTASAISGRYSHIPGGKKINPKRWKKRVKNAVQNGSQKNFTVFWIKVLTSNKKCYRKISCSDNFWLNFHAGRPGALKFTKPPTR